MSILLLINSQKRLAKIQEIGKECLIYKIQYQDFYSDGFKNIKMNGWDDSHLPSFRFLIGEIVFDVSDLSNQKRVRLKDYLCYEYGFTYKNFYEKY